MDELDFTLDNWVGLDMDNTYFVKWAKIGNWFRKAQSIY